MLLANLTGIFKMCLGIPMQVKSIDGFIARCEAKGIERDVNLFMMQDVEFLVGDYVIADRGYAIQKVTPEDASSAWELLDQILDDPKNLS